MTSTSKSPFVLRWAEWALWLSIAVTAFIAVFVLASGIFGNGPVEAKVHVSPSAAQLDRTFDQLGVSQKVTDVDVEAHLDVVPTKSERLLLALGGAVQLLVLVGIEIVLLRLVRSARRVDPFLAANVRRMRFIALFVALGSASTLLRSWITALVVDDDPIAKGLDATSKLNYDVSFLLVALGIVLLTEIFRSASNLHHEVEGTI